MRPKQIKELVKIVEESNIGELEVTKWWGNKVRICKTANSVQLINQPSMVTATAPAVVPTPGKAPSLPAEEQRIDTTPLPATSKDIVEIRSPMVGTFYRAPAPDAAPYVEVGDMVSPGKVLCIIEAMKLMNEIEAEISGRIVEILVENAKPVEYNQILFRIQPS